ncbi:MAG TPA: ABC transporter permease [Thermoanaerobaculia bacterium]|jgi:putative ABC transport system permease protein|nr:ABC transporter permease [Thermoanaerobaculia bacterium]
MHDLKFALRNLRRSPGYAAAAILTLAIAIGANTSMFSILYAVVLRPLAFREPERVVRVWQTDQHNASPREGASAPDLRDWQQQQRVFSAIAGTSNRMLNLTETNAEAERIATTGVSHDYFSMLGVAPLAGRGFLPNDDREGAEPVAVISDAFWQRRFGGANVIGRGLTLDGKRYEIVGVMPIDASLSRSTVTDVWLPLTGALAPFGDVRGVHNVYVLARLKNGVTPEQAQSAMTVISTRLEQQYPDDNKGRGAFVEPVLDSMVRDARPRLYILSAAVLAVLLIACINVAGLMLARADTRARELAIRTSLGASRGRIVRQLLTESVALAAIGGILGVALAWWATRTILALAPTLPRAEGIGISVPVLVFAVLASMLSAILFGVIPALRTSAVQPALALAAGSRGVLRATRTAGRGVLVITEVALAVVLVTGAGLLLKSFAKLLAVDVGLNTDRVVTFSMKLPEAKYPLPPRDKYPQWPEATNFYDAALARVSELPGVTRAALGMNHPLDTGFTSQITIVGQPESDAQKDEVRIRPITPAYFETLGIALLRGRPLSRDDRGSSPMVIVVNEALAQKYFRGEDPVGKQMAFWGTPRTIVGVVKGERFGGPQNAAEPALYPPLTQVPMSDLTLAVRASGDPATVIAAVRDTMRTLDSDIALFEIEMLDETLARTVATPRFQAVLIASFGAIALLLAAIGLYALIAYQVQQRTNEIGVRLALGATRAEIARLVMARAAALALTGIAIGLAGALATARFLKAVVYEISPTDPAIYAAVPLLLVAIALIATWIPVRRAMRLDPAVALHMD